MTTDLCLNLCGQSKLRSGLLKELRNWPGNQRKSHTARSALWTRGKNEVPYHMMEALALLTEARTDAKGTHKDPQRPKCLIPSRQGLSTPMSPCAHVSFHDFSEKKRLKRRDKLSTKDTGTRGFTIHCVCTQGARLTRLPESHGRRHCMAFRKHEDEKTPQRSPGEHK